MRKFQNFHVAARPQHFKTLVLYTFSKERPFLTPPYFDSISGNSFLQIIADPRYPTRCAWHPPSSLTAIFLEIQNPWGKVMERSGLTFEHFCSKVV